MANTHWLNNGPVALIWSARMALLEPQHLARVGKQHPKTFRSKEITLLREKLNTVKKCNTLSTPVTQRHDLTHKGKVYAERISLCVEAHKQRKHLEDLRNVINGDKEQPDVPHYIANNSDKRNAADRINAVQHAEGQGKYDNTVEIHPSWTYKEIGPGTAGQAEDEHQLYKIPTSICNIQQSRKLMEHAENGTLKSELYARCRTAHDGITYLSGTTTFGTKQHYCKNMLFDTGCDFNITSAWYLRDMLGKGWKRTIKPIPGRTITAKMATGHASQAIGTITMEVTFAVTALDGNNDPDGLGPQPLVDVNQLVEGRQHQDDIGWTTTTKAIEYLVFDGIDLPIINGAPFLSHVVSDISCHDQAPTHARIHGIPYVPGEKRKPSEQHVMMRRRRVAPLTQVLVCCAKKDTWVSTLQPQAIAVDTPGCTKVAKVGVLKDGKIIDEEPNLDTNLERVPLHYLMDTVQQYGQLYDTRSRFVTDPDSRYMSAIDVNNRLQEGKLEVVVQGKPEETQNKETPAALPKFYNREQDIVTKTIPEEMTRQGMTSQGGGVYIKAGTVVAILEFEAEDERVESQDTHRAGGCNHIMDDKFVPTELNKQNPNDGGVYTFQSLNQTHGTDHTTQIRESESTRYRVATVTESKYNAAQAEAMNTVDEETRTALGGTHFTEEHLLKCAQPTMIAKELRRRITEESVRDESTTKQMETYAAQDLRELFESVSGTSNKLARWAVQTIDELITSTVLQTTRIHNERLVDRCRRVEVYRLFAENKRHIQMGGKRGYAAPSEAVVAYRRLIADNAAKQLKQELHSVLLRTCYMEELNRILRGTKVQEDIEQVDNKIAQHIRQLIGTSEQHEQYDNITETTAAQMQGLLAETLPPRAVQQETISEHISGVNKSKYAEHDRLLCGIRSAHDKIDNNVPKRVYIDPESGVAHIEYVAQQG